MTTTRILPGVLLALAATTGPAAAQFRTEAEGSFGRNAGAPPGLSGVSVDPPEYGPMPLGRPPAAAGPNPVDRLSSSLRTAGEDPDPYGTLTGQPAPQFAGPGLPHGSYPSPYYTDGPGCCGPLGRNGRVGYEFYNIVGANLPFGPGLGTLLNGGVMVGGGGRSLFFNREHDAAWVVDLGISYTFNPGKGGRPRDIFLKQPVLQNPITGAITPQADALTLTNVRGLDRTSFNFALGRDWWCWGPGAVGAENGWNLRWGGMVGGRWGTAHVDMRPVDQPNGYSRRQNVYHGVFVSTHVTVEVPMGAWIGFIGGRADWGYDWTNLIPPLQGNISNVNLYLFTGIRF